MPADELDRRVEPVGVLALVGVVEELRDRVDGGTVDRAVGQQDLDSVLLVGIAQVRVATEADLVRR